MRQIPDLSDSAAAVVIAFDAIVKAHAPDASGRRILETECSVETPDMEGDVCEQKALLDAAEDFIKSGHIDLDHISEIGSRYGIADPKSYIIGRPLEVKDLGNKRTSVVFALDNTAIGNEIFNQIKSGIAYKSSIYGFPYGEDGGVEDCRFGTCSNGSTRFTIKSILWKSLALTRHPVCDAIKSPVRILTAKSFALELIKGGVLPPYQPAPPSMVAEHPTPPHEVPMMGNSGSSPIQNQGPFIQSLNGAPDASSQDVAPMAGAPVPGGGIVANATETDMGGGAGPDTAGGANFHYPFEAPRHLMDAMGQYHSHMKRDCAHTMGLKSTIGFRDHFMNCCGLSKDAAELWGHALMHMLNLESKRV